MNHPFYEKRKKTTASQRQEKDLARSLSGRCMPGSGSSHQIHKKGDVRFEDFVLEAKETSKRSFSLKFHDLAKIQILAFQQDLCPALSLRFNFETRNILQERDWVVIPLSLFKELLSERRTQRKR